MTKHYIAKSDLVFNGVQIHDKSEKLSLTDMWEASGSIGARKPSEWLRSAEAKHFISFLAETKGISEVGKSHFGLVVTNKGGTNKGQTWAHWQIALAYAKYLSPEFHMWCNQVVRAHMEGRAVATASNLTKYDTAIIGNVVKNCTGVIIREELGNILPALIEASVSARMAETNLLIRHGKTAGQIYNRYNLPRLKNAPTWLGNRLKEMGCALDGGLKAEQGDRAVRLFDPDKADICLKNGLLHKTKVYISERLGQQKLRLVTKEAK